MQDNLNKRFMNILLIIEFNYFSKTVQNFINKNKNSRFTFLLINSSKKEIEKNILKIYNKLNFEIIDSSDFNNLIENYYKKNYLDIISVSNYFTSLFDISSNWNKISFIISDFYEKNQFKSNHNLNFIYFLIFSFILKEKKYNYIFLDNLNHFCRTYLRKFHLIKSNINFSVNNFFINFLNSLIFLFYQFLRSLLFKTIFLLKKIDYNRSKIFQTYFPYYNPNKFCYNLEEDCFYFNKITKYYLNENIWMLHSIKSNDINYFNKIKYLINCKSNITLLENEIKIIDYLKIFFIYIYYNFSKKITYINNKKINKLINIEFFLDYSLNKSFSSKNFIYSLFCFFAYKNFFNKIKKKSKFIYLCEMQSWEKAANINKPQNIKSIAYNHTSVCSYYLFFFPSLLDFKINSFKNILPDILITNGNNSKLLFSKYNKYFDIRIAESLRYQHLNIRNSENSLTKKNQLLFLFSIDKFESKFLLNLLYNLLDDIRFSNYLILVKFHPSYKIENIPFKYKNKIIFLNSSNYIQQLINSKFVITGTSSASVEALFYNCFLFVPNMIFPYFKPPILDFINSANKFNSLNDIEAIIKSDKSKKFEYNFSFIRNYWNIDYDIPINLKNIIDE